jgi:hypothetical protein
MVFPILRLVSMVVSSAPGPSAPAMALARAPALLTTERRVRSNEPRNPGELRYGEPRPTMASQNLVPLLAAPVLALLAACAPPPPPPPAALRPPPQPAEIEILDPPLQGFYGKRLREGGIPILAHGSVSDEALQVARDHLRRMLEHAPALRRNLEARGHELHVIGLRQFTSDLPEYRSERGKRLDTGELFDWHMIGGHIVDNLSSCTEATLLPIVGHRLFGDDTCSHELGHAVDTLALGTAAHARVHAAYVRSMESGHWQGKYAAKNEREWFAELTKYYFRPEGDGLGHYFPHPVEGRTYLRREDPEGFQLVDDLYSGRLDPGALRTLPLGPGRDEPTLRSPPSRSPTQLTVRNRTAADIRLVWIDFDGKRDTRVPFEQVPLAPPGRSVTKITFAGHVWAVTDAAGRALCTVTAAEEDGTADVTGPCP